MADNPSIPILKTSPPKDIEEACTEYLELQDAKKNSPPHGWANWLSNAIEQRLNTLRQFITDETVEAVKKYQEEFFKETENG